MAQILVVDDDPATCRALAGLLRLEGHRADCARDGQEALRALEERVPDLIVLDMMMPRVDGLTLLARIRADSRFAAVPVVIYTAVDDAHRREQARRLDAHSYVIKGAAWPALFERILCALAARFPDLPGTSGAGAGA
jgi:CheY-like chemotaxis protein